MLTAVLVTPRFRPASPTFSRVSSKPRQDQLVTLVAADYRRNGGWNPQSLNQLAPTVTMTGSEAEVRDAARSMWSLAAADVDPATLAMHRTMMGTGDLGPRGSCRSPSTEPGSGPLSSACRKAQCPRSTRISGTR